MKSFTISANKTNQQSEALPKGQIRIRSTVPVYYRIGSDPIVDKLNSAIIKPNTDVEIRIPVKCLKLAVVAVQDSGTVTVTEMTGGARASCSA